MRDAYLNNDIILLEGLVVEGTFQDILNTGSVTHLQAKQTQMNTSMYESTVSTKLWIGRLLLRTWHTGDQFRAKLVCWVTYVLNCTTNGRMANV